MLGYLKKILFTFGAVLKSKYKWLAIFFMVLLYRIEFIPDTGEGLAKGIQVGALFFILCFMFKYDGNFVRKSFRSSNMPIKSILVLYIYAMISTLWALMPQLAFFMSFQNVVMIMLMHWLLTRFSDFKSTEKTFVYFLMLMIILENIGVRLSSQRVLIAHFLPAASSAAILFSYSIGEYFATKSIDSERKRFLRDTFVLCVCFLIINTSGGANSSALFGFAVALWIARKYIPAFVVTGAAVFILTNQDLLNEIILTLMPDKNLEQIETGNGRQEIWENLIAAAAEKPVCGWGFACVERTVQSIFEDQILSDAHNNYIGMYGSLGIIGLVLFCFHYVVQLLSSLRRRLRPGYVGIICATACAMLNGYSYGFMSGKTCSITIAYFAVVILTLSYSKCKYYDRKAIKR